METMSRDVIDVVQKAVGHLDDLDHLAENAIRSAERRAAAQYDRERDLAELLPEAYSARSISHALTIATTNQALMIVRSREWIPGAFTRLIKLRGALLAELAAE